MTLQFLTQFYHIYKDLFIKCQKSDSNFYYIVFHEIRYRIFKRKKLWLHQKVTLKHIDHINLQKGCRLNIGIEYIGFCHQNDRTLLNIKGKLNIKSSYSIGRGCRIDIGPKGIVNIGTGGYINAFTTLIIMNRLEIGDNTAISWGCQFLDENFHEIEYEGKKVAENSIIIGNNVWIGCGAKIYKGTVLADNCIVASDSIVRGIFNDNYSLIAGNPAKVIKSNVYWR